MEIMRDMILLSQLTRLQNTSAEQIRVCICTKEDDTEIISMQTLKYFSEINKVYGKLAEQYKVFGIDTKNNILVVYVIEIK